MAQVLSPLSSSTSTITMLHSRPSSSDAFQASSVGQSYQQSQRTNSAPRSMYSSQAGYRGASAAPVQTYAFQTTPNLRQETRTVSGPTTLPQSQSSSSTTRHGHRNTSSTSTVASDVSSASSAHAQRSPNKDELFSGSARNSFINISSSIPDLSLTSFENVPKSSPNRYRRSPQRIDSNGSMHRSAAASTTAAPSGSGTGAAEHLYSATPPPPRIASFTRVPSDDFTITKSPTSEAAKRYRRRSLNTLETSNSGPGNTAGQPSQGQRPVSYVGQSQSTIRPVSHHSRNGSSESMSGRRPPSATPPPEHVRQSIHSGQNNPVKAPIRGSSTTRSPLSKLPITSNAQSPVEETPLRMPVTLPSPAAQHLAALSDKDLNRGMKSRLRRAFSFGSSAELRRSAENVPPQQINTTEEMDPETAKIARQQEAAGIGAGIYSGQGGFTGSTDNLSISSTASSASMMLRKMGKGMKKGGRSLKGLFRPKSVIGVPAADGPVQPSLSMVTVEAERQKVNVNAHPADQVGGGTGFPKLQQNSLEATHAARAASSDGQSSQDRNDSMRKSIVGNDNDRAEVLAAVKKGILKRAGTGSLSTSPVIRPRDGALSIDTQYLQSPASSMPTTPRDDRASRSMSPTNSDYFVGRPNVAMFRSMPGTPNGLRNISFSPRLQFYDAWSSTDYDRRGEIATCNRLTPMLAQQIKEELNTFKMEMEVHEQSKPHTHFF